MYSFFSVYLVKNSTYCMHPRAYNMQEICRCSCFIMPATINRKRKQKCKKEKLGVMFYQESVALTIVAVIRACYTVVYAPKRKFCDIEGFCQKDEIKLLEFPSQEKSSIPHSSKRLHYIHFVLFYECQIPAHRHEM